MKRSASLTSTLLCFGGIALMLSACTGNGSESSAIHTSDPNTAPQSPDAPLDEFLGSGWDGLSEEEAVRRLEDQHMQQQELVAQCMRDAGFDYLPVPAVFTISTGPSAQDDFRPDDVDWVSQWGYGVVSRPGEDIAEAAPMETATPPANPNAEVLENMSDAERTAWDQALRGELAGFTGAIPNNIPLENQGCTGWAQNESLRNSVVFPDQLLMTDEFAPLYQALMQMRRESALSPDVAAADLDWSNCLANAGFPGFDRQPLAQLSIVDQFFSARDANASVDEIAALQEQEISLALADLECRNATDYAARRAAGLLAAETQFVNDHRSELEAFRAALEQAAP